jgi:hypothetical protein
MVSYYTAPLFSAQCSLPPSNRIPGGYPGGISGAKISGGAEAPNTEQLVAATSKCKKMFYKFVVLQQ